MRFTCSQALRFFLATILVPVGLAVASPKDGSGVSDEEYIARVVRYLSSPSLAGRKTGSFGSFLAARFIAGELLKAGVRPLQGGIDDFKPAQTRDYFHYFRFTPEGKSPDRTGIQGRNIIGIINPSGLQKNWGYILLVAHYDHLGSGIGKLGRWEYFPGANDNASGVSVLLQLVRSLCSPSRSATLDYPIVLLFTDAEEAGLKGARAFVAHPPAALAGYVPALVINLDTLNLTGGKLYVGSDARIRKSFSVEVSVVDLLAQCKEESQFSYEIVPMRTGLSAGDHYAFYEAQIPFIFFFGGAPLTYHRTDDTWEKIDYACLSQIARLLESLLVNLQDAEKFARVDVGEIAVAPGGERRTFLGTIPDFSRVVENGVLLAGVVPESPAEKAGLRAGDILRKVAGKETKDLKTFSEILKSLEPGELVMILFERDGELYEVSAEVIERPE